jgi:energy-coupling factor transporter ATP-binding protein EcfA2
MTRREIREKFDRIVAFAELEPFIDTPMKFYSTGMQMRLGFAVTAHTEPDILLIDEILAVGDAAFQAKCLSKLAEFKAQEKTIIVVSHTMANILDHARTVAWLDAGRLRMLGEPHAVVRAYLDEAASRRPAAGDGAPPSAEDAIAILDVRLLDERERPRAAFDRGETLLLDIAYAAAGPVPGAVFGVTFQDVHGDPLGGVLTDPDDTKVDDATGRSVLRLRLAVPFTRGTYTLTARAGDPRQGRTDRAGRHTVQLVVDGQRAADRGAIGHVHYPHRWERLR